VRISGRIKLCLNCIDNVAITVPETGDSRATGTIKILLAVFIIEINSLTVGHDRKIGFSMARENVAHDFDSGQSELRSE
jgi:hypothetical protein